MSDDITIDVGMDPSQYLAGADQLTGANSRLQQSMGGVVTTSAGVQKALQMITPGRATLAGLGALAAAAGNAEQELSGLSATSAITGISTGKLAQGIRSLAREMPLGNTATRQVVEQFTKMGVSAAGSEQKIVDLSKGVIRLSGATGEGPGGLATGMTQFARATGNVNLDTKRFDNLSDSLVKVSKTTGAGATDILAFSKNIAPMAQAAGIGATGILGISGAFARLGEDGVGASTAVNKMLTDMSRSVREGGPQMKTYAEIVGTTADEFERMFKSNPTEALNKVVESISKAGPQGPRQLEMLGLDGVRSQRALQALSASGGLRPAVDAANEGYGSGAATKAAEAAFGGLNDSFTELRSSSEQLAQILGAPLTAPLKAFADGLKVSVGAITGVAASKPAQAALTAAGMGLTGLLGAKAIMGPLSLLGVGRQAGKSGPVRSVLAGLSLGAEDDRGSTRRSRVGEPMLQAYEDGTLGNGMMGGVNTRGFDFGLGMGERLKKAKDADAAKQAAADAKRISVIGQDAFDKEQAITQRRRDMNPVQRAADTAKTYGMTGLNTYISEMGRQFENASIDDPRRRKDTLATPDEAREAGRRAKTVMDNGGSMKEAFDAFHDHLVGAGKDAGSFGETLKATVSAARSARNLSGSLAGDAHQVGGGALRRGGRMAMAGMGALGDMLGFGGIAGMGIAGGLALWQAGKASTERRKQELSDFADSDMYGRLNAYREASGRAGMPAKAVTAGTAMEVQERSKDITATDALKVTDDDVRLAEGSKDKKVTDYYGTKDQIAQQIAGMNAKGLDPQDLQSVKYDLLRGGRSTDEVQAILNKLPASATRENTVAPAGSNAEGIAAMVKGAQSAPGGGAAGFFQTITGQKDEGTRNSIVSQYLPKSLDMRPGGGLYIDSMSQDSKDANSQISKSIQSRYDEQSGAYKGQYANQERLKAMNAAIKTATDSGDYEQADYLSRQFQTGLMGKDYETKTLTSQDIEKAGGFSQALAAADKDGFGKTYDRFTKEGGSVEEGKGVAAQRAPSYYADILRKSGNDFAGSMFDNTRPNAQTQAIADSVDHPESASKMNTAVDAFVTGGQKAGLSLSQVGTAAIKAANEVSATSQAFAIMRQVWGKSDQMVAQQAVAGSQTGTQVTLERRGTLMDRRDALKNPQTDEARAMREGIIGEMTSIDEGLKQRLVARLETQRQFEKTSARQLRDHNKQMAYAEVDYQTQVDRTNEAHETQRQRSIDAFGRQQERAEKDFGTARFRTIRDFNLSIERAEKDSLKTRQRAVRDFNIGLTRQIEDAAKTMYSPYDRIQTKATWDAQNLMVNMREQNEAMAKQKAQLDQLRKMGLSDQAIDQLQLGKTENAQQVNNLVQDFGTDPSQVAEMNKLAQTRGKNAGDLYTDKSNTDLKRSREDLAKGLKDMGEDLRTSLGRARTDLAKNLKDQADDFAKNMKRSRTDFNISLSQSEQDLARNLGYMEDDQTKSVNRQRDAFNTAMSDMRKDVKDADLSIAGDFKTLTDSVNKAIHGQSVNWGKLLVNDTKTLVGDLNTKVVPDVMKALAQVGLTKADLQAASNVNTDRAASAGGGQSTHGGQTRAEGGPIEGYSPHPKADNVPIWATAGEFMHPVDAVKHYGVNTMEAIRKKKIPKEALQGFADGGLIGFGHKLQSMGYSVSEHPSFGGVHPVHTPGSQHYNKRGPGGGGAIDVNADPFNSPFKNEKAALDKIIGLAGQYGLRSIWQVANHFDHAHFDIGNGDNMLGGSYHGSSSMPTGGATGSFDLNKAFARLNKKKAWVYKALGEKIKAAMAAKVDQLGGGSLPGDGGAHGASASSNQAIARRLLGSFGWGPDQMGPLVKLWNGESGWNQFADNPSSDAYGIPQALPGSKMASAGSDWKTNPETQIKWGLKYIKDRPDYGSPAKAWAMWNSRSPHWYDNGGFLKPGMTTVMNGTGGKEAVLTGQQWASISKLAQLGGSIISREQAGGIATAGSHVVINNNQTITYDNRNDFADAKITVMSNDPDDMGRRLERRERGQRLTSTRGVRRNR